MGERRVSEAQPLPVRVSVQAGAAVAGARPGLRSRTATAGFLADYPRMIRIRNRYSNQPGSKIHEDFQRVLRRYHPYVQQRFQKLKGDDRDLNPSDPDHSLPEQRYRLLQQMARQAEEGRNPALASKIREALTEIDRHAHDCLQALCSEHGLAGESPTQSTPQTPAATPPQWDWCTAHQRLQRTREYLYNTGRVRDARYFDACIERLENHVKHRFIASRGQPADLQPFLESHDASSQRMYLAIEGMACRAEAAGDGREAVKLRRRVDEMKVKVREELSLLAGRHESLEALAVRAGSYTRLQAPVTAGPQATPATAPVTVAPPLQRADPAAAQGSGFARARLSTAGEAAFPSGSELAAEQPGPSSRVMPAPAPTPAAPAPEVPLARRRDIVEHFSSDEAVLDAGFAVGSSATDALGWGPGRADRVLDDVQRLNSSAATDPAAAASLPGIDWSGIEALMGIMEFVPPSPSPSPDI